MKQLLFYILILGITLASCQQKQEKKTANTLVVGAMSSLDFVPLAVAKKMNFFEENGVDVRIEKFYSANDRDAAFHSHNVDGTVIDYTGAILQKSGGIELKLTSSCDAPFGIVTSTQSGVDKIADLKGKKVSVSRNTVIDFCIDMALEHDGLTENDIEKIEINKIPLRFEMLMKGETDATALPDPFLTMATNKGCKCITTMDQLGYKVTGFAFSQQAINEKSEEIRAFYKAYNKAVDYISGHSVDDIKDILTGEIGFPEELIPQVKLPAYSHAQLPDNKDIEATVTWLKNKKLVPDTFEASSVIDNQFIK